MTAESEVPFRVWVVYFSPDDFPGLYVLRIHAIYSKERVEISPFARTAPTLTGIRELIPGGLYQMPRFPEDDPVIVETWF